MTWRYPLLTFTCGACGTTVTGLVAYMEVQAIQRTHAEHCPGHKPLPERVDAVATHRVAS